MPRAALPAASLRARAPQPPLAPGWCAAQVEFCTSDKLGLYAEFEACFEGRLQIQIEDVEKCGHDGEDPCKKSQQQKDLHIRIHQAGGGDIRGLAVAV